MQHYNKLFWNTCLAWCIFALSSFSCKFTTLSVTPLGPRSESFIAFLDTGNMPVFLKPDCTAATVKDFLQVGRNGIQKSPFGIPTLTFWNKYSLRLMFQLVLKFAKGVESSGCRTWDVWPGMARTSILFVTIKFKNGKLYICDLCTSSKSRCFLLKQLHLFSHWTHLIEYLKKTSLFIHPFDDAFTVMLDGTFTTQASLTFAPLNITRGGYTWPQAFTKVKRMVVSPVLFGT